MKVGRNDAFERVYTAKFKEFASRYGEFVNYERDRGSRDIGLHLVRSTNTGNELVSSSLAWFQLKGITKNKIPSTDGMDSIPIVLETKHLRFWFALPTPTYLVLYLECIDDFFVIDIQKVIQKTWGRNIFGLAQDSATVRIETSCRLDQTAFFQILLENDSEAWAARFSHKRDDLKLAILHHELIARIRTKNTRKTEQRFIIRDWLSKTRIEVHLLEKKQNTENQEIVWQEWAFMRSPEDIEEAFPYLSLQATEESGSEPWDDDVWFEVLHLQNGDTVYAENCSGEIADFECHAELNDLGKDLAAWLEQMVLAGFLDVNFDKPTLISIAPWNYRGI